MGAFLRFFLFLFILSIVAFSLANFRSQDKDFLYADTSFSLGQKSAEEVPLWMRYGFFWKKLLWESGGKTNSGETVYEFLLPRLLPTFHLAFFSLGLGICLGIFLPLGLLPLKRKELFFSIFSKTAEVILSTPIFVLGVLLLVFFFFRWELLPPGGYESGNFLYVILPGIALGSRVFARLFLYCAPEFQKEWESPYAFVQRTRGASLWDMVWLGVFWKYFPLLVILVLLDLGSLLSGAMVIEELFFFPGLGRALFYAIKTMDTDLLSVLLIYSGLVFYAFQRVGDFLRKRTSGE